MCRKSTPRRIKWENSPPYCRQLPALEKIEPGRCETD